MKAISASIVILSGAIMLCFGATLRGDGQSLFISGCGFIIAFAGLAGWIGTFIGLFEDK